MYQKSPRYHAVDTTLLPACQSGCCLKEKMHSVKKQQQKNDTFL